MTERRETMNVIPLQPTIPLSERALAPGREMSSNKKIFGRVAMLLLACAMVLISADRVSAQSRVATSAASFLTIGSGARGSSLGHAYTATATGADALLWNPAGAARTVHGGGKGSLFFSHTDWLVGINYDAFGLVIPAAGQGVVGISLAQMDYGRMIVRTVDLPEGTGETFGASDLLIGVSYAQPLTDRFFIGGTGKYIGQRIYDMSASTFAFDIGFVLQTDYFNGMRIAASIMNFGGLMKMDGVNSRVFVDIDPTSSGSNDALPATLETTGWDLPLSFKFGVALPLVKTDLVAWELLADAHQTNDNGLNMDMGTEMRFSVSPAALNLRVGYKDMPLDNTYSHLTFGAGVDMTLSGVRFGADYGYVPFVDLGNVSMLDFRVTF